MFNALKYTKQLELVGLTREQAETHVQIMMDVMDTNFATKADIKAEIKDLENKLLRMEHRILLRSGVMMSAIVTVALTISLTIFGYFIKAN